jgi:uncharacterized membrane protein YgcG
MKKITIPTLCTLSAIVFTLFSCNTSKHSVVFIDDVYYNPKEAKRLAMIEEREWQKQQEEGLASHLPDGKKIKTPKTANRYVSPPADPHFRMSYGAYFNRFGNGFHPMMPPMHRNQIHLNFNYMPYNNWGYQDPWYGYNGMYDPYCNWGGGFGGGFHQPHFTGMYHNPYQAGFMNGFMMGQHTAPRNTANWGGGGGSGFVHSSPSNAQPIMVRRTSYGTNQTAVRRDNVSGYGTVKSPNATNTYTENTRSSGTTNRATPDRINQPTQTNRQTSPSPTSGRSSSYSEPPQRQASPPRPSYQDRSAEPSPNRNVSPPPAPPARESTPSRSYNQPAPSQSPPRTYSPPPSSSGTHRGSAPSSGSSSGGGSSSSSNSSSGSTNRGGRR